MNGVGQDSGVFIVGAACVFPSGPRLALADAAVCVSMALFRKHPFWVDSCGQRPTVSCFPADAVQPSDSKGVIEDIFGGPRWAELVTAALKDLATSLKPGSSAPMVPPAAIPCALWLVFPDAPTPGVPRDAMSAIDAALQAPEIRASWNWQRATVVRGGHAAGVLALQQAQAFLQTEANAQLHPENQPLLAVVLAVDCPLTAARLENLEQQSLLRGANQRVRGEVRSNPYGRRPGEGAAAVALSQMPMNAIAKVTAGKPTQQGSAPRTWSARYLDEAKQATVTATAPRFQPWVQLLGASTAQEEITWARTQAQGQPCLGFGLTQAALSANQQAGNAPLYGADHNLPRHITQITTDFNGEPYRGDELGFTVLRLAQQASQPQTTTIPTLHSGWQRRNPALASGDLGSASAIANTALAAYNLHRASSATDLGTPACHLVLSSSDDPLRGAVVLGALHHN